MTDMEAVAMELDTAEDRGVTISDGCARTIAAWWQGGDPNGRLFADFASSGAIRDVEAFTGAIDRLAEHSLPSDARPLHRLKDYVRARGYRGAVNGWSNVWVR